MSKKVVFRTFDPFHKEITLFQNTWEKCQSVHQEIKDHYEIKDTVESPISIKIDKNKKTTHNYYKENDTKNKNEKYLKVCVNFEEDRRKGKISTAYKCDKIHSEDEELWTK